MESILEWIESFRYKPPEEDDISVLNENNDQIIKSSVMSHIDQESYKNTDGVGQAEYVDSPSPCVFVKRKRHHTKNKTWTPDMEMNNSPNGSTMDHKDENQNSSYIFDDNQSNGDNSQLDSSEFDEGKLDTNKLDESKVDTNELDEVATNESAADENETDENATEDSQIDETIVDLVKDYLNVSIAMKTKLLKYFSNDSTQTYDNIFLKSIGHGCVSLASCPGESSLCSFFKNDLNDPFYSLKSYQKVGILWLLALHESDYCGILADEMGLGKTAQTLTFLRICFQTQKINDPVIILCPSTLIDNWLNEISVWAPELRKIKYHGTQKERKAVLYDMAQDLENDNNIHIVVTSYQCILSSWDYSVFFKYQKFSYVVIDEAHNLKNSETQLYNRVKKKLNCDKKILLTGSPIQNELSELQNLFFLTQPNMINPDKFSQASELFCQRPDIFSSYTSKYLNEEMNQSHSDPSKINTEFRFLQYIFTPFILRRSKVEVILDLPPKHTYIELCNMIGRQYKMYIEEIHKAKSEFAKVLCCLSLVSKDSDGNTIENNESNLTKQLSKSNDSSSIQNLMFRLRRICNHPLLYRNYYSTEDKQILRDCLKKDSPDYHNVPLEKIDKEIDSLSDFEIYTTFRDHDIFSKYPHLNIPVKDFLDSAKIIRMFEIVDELGKKKSKALIFSQFTTYLDIIEECLHIHRPQIEYLRLDGNTPIISRQKLVDSFTSESKYLIFLLSTKAGGYGLNLTAANTVILMDQDWNPQNDRQAEDRVHRLGQKQSVTIYRLCCKNSLEESILKCAERKLYLDEAFGGKANYVTASIIKDCFETSANLHEPISVPPKQINTKKRKIKKIS